MGWFGPDNFDNDRGLDYLDEVAEPIWEKIAGLLEHPNLADPSEPDSDETMAAVELLAILCENTPNVPPATREVEKCRDNFIQFWYGSMQDWIHSGARSKPNPDFVEARRAVMERTFERLLIQCRRAEEEGLCRD